MEHVLLVVHVIIAAALIGLVLIQRSDTDGFGLGSGGGQNFLTGRASANLLTRATAIVAALFIINSLVLSVLAARGHAPSIVDTIEQQQQSDTKGAPAVPVPGAESKTTLDKSAAKPVEAKPAVPAAPKTVAKKPAAKPAVPTEGSENSPNEKQTKSDE
jgi:preprotein translocase subunit SecG